LTKFAAFLATSLDGFIARSDGSIDWLEQANALVQGGEDCGYLEFFNSVDGIVLGRKSFEKVMSFPEWPYNGKKVYVLSRGGLKCEQVELPSDVHVLSANIEDLAQSLQDKGHHKVYVDGGEVIRQFIHARLLDELTITRVPVLIHSGTPLFKNDRSEGASQRSDVWMELVQSRTWPFGFTQDVWHFKNRRC
jgi:dihydrofolate reductase